VRGVTILAVCVAEPLSAGPVSTIPTAKLLSHAKSINHCLLEFLLKLAARGKHYLIYFLDTKQEISGSKSFYFIVRKKLLKMVCKICTELNSDHFYFHISFNFLQLK
jgi:hypothetical protein